MKELFAFLFVLGAVYALTPGTYTDYTWEENYQEPIRPFDKLNITNCGQLIDQENCEAIIDSNRSDEKKIWLVLQIKAGEEDKNSFVNGWNNEITFTKYAPEGTAIRNGQIIKNAWVKIVSVSPSVIDLKDKVWVPESSELRAEYNLDMVVRKLEVPDTCSINYNIVGYDYSLETFVDGQLVGTGSNRMDLHLSKEHASVVEIETKLSFVADYSVDVYKTHTGTVCEESGNVTVCYDYSRCELEYTAPIHDEGSVSDFKTIYFYNESLANATGYLEYSNDGTVTGWLAAAMPEGQGFEFSLQDAKHESALNSYQITESMKPYNILSVAIASNATSARTLGMSVSSLPTRDGMPQTRQSKLFERLDNSESADVYFISKFTAPGGGIENMDCGFVFASHFSEREIPIECRYPGVNSTIEIRVLNSTTENDTVIAVIRFFDGNNNESFPNKELDTIYGNSVSPYVTDNEGIIRIKLNRTKTGSYLSARFETDTEIPGSSTRVFVGPKGYAIDFMDLVNLAALGSIFYVGFKKLAIMTGGFV